MDPDYSLQDLIRCNLCETTAPQLYCNICHINLCKACAGEHLLDESKFHLVVPSKQRPSISAYNTKCLEHSTKLCELHCEQCSIPVCVQCVSSKKHKTHDVVDIVKFMESKKMALQADLEELGKIIYPNYQEIASSISLQKENLKRNTKKLIVDFYDRGRAWHEKINKIIKKLISNIHAIEIKRLDILKKQEGEIKQGTLKITETIEEIKKTLDSNDVNLLSKYKSLNEELKSFPHKIVFSLPAFSSQKIDTKQLFQQFGTLSDTTEKSVLSSDEAEFDDSLDH